MSLLEKLPTELLERVFQFCLNLDLPKASPVIAGKLSSNTVFNWTVMRVFGASWERAYAKDTVVGEKDLDEAGDERDREMGGRGDWGEEDSDLQSQVLRCRWTSLEVLLKAKEAWIQRYAADSPFVPLYFLKAKNKPRGLPPPSSIPFEPLSSQTPNTPPPEQPPPPSESPEPPTSRLTSTQYHDQDYAYFLDFVSSPDGPSPWPHITWSSTSTLSPNIEIPNSLLTPPFTSISLQHLFYLLKSGARVSWLTSTSGEVAFEGLKEAIREGNVEAVHLLMWSGLLERMDVEVLVWAMRNVGSSAGLAPTPNIGDEDEQRLGKGKVLSLEEKVRTINQILRLGFTAMDSWERGRIEAELLVMRDEAIMRDYEEGLEFVRRIVGSETLKGVVDVRV
ncbi:magnesium ion transporter, variant 2 [Cadophora gregata]|nr:magnesium ion transporter, variant 2 [Cadophora gregata]KAK0112869.1 magnesium ion transporter, variant 2 [Cadophora gregata]KAK0124997.1 magnesium ion transporter, variant 2 [Cadophora gregata f. sp. sojae]